MEPRLSDDARIRLLIADGETSAAGGLELFLGERGFETTSRPDGRAALDALRSDTFDVALLDTALLDRALPAGALVDTLRGLREDAVPCEVILIVGGGSIPGASDVALDGEYDQVARPYQVARVAALARRAWRRRQLALENQLLRARLASFDDASELLTHYAPMRAVMALIDRVARSDSAVLIGGEAGSGKRLMARTIHARSHRAGGPFVEVDCSEPPVDVLESRLFGREYETSSGAASRQLGLFELASNGTIFLANVDALHTALQGKLLHALELGTFYRTGGTQKAHANPRIIAASRDDLPRLVGEGSGSGEGGAFRGDLYYRINTISIAVPPLRERSVDIALLGQNFLQQLGASPSVELGSDAVAALEAYSWPGNVRELRTVIERAAPLAVDGVIHAKQLSIFAGGAPAGEESSQAAAAGEHCEPLEEVERAHIEAVLRHAGWHQARAAEMLGISPKTLYRKIRQFGFQRPSARHEQST